MLIAASLVFYAWWDARFLILPVAQITATWLLALAHERTGSKAALIAGIVLNLASLGTFKYLDFALQSVEAATGLALPRAHIILPIGISFFSFQLISYLVDRMRGEGADLSAIGRSRCSCCCSRISLPARSFATTSSFRSSKRTRAAMDCGCGSASGS